MTAERGVVWRFKRSACESERRASALCQVGREVSLEERRGFTLLEVSIVLVVLAVLLAVAIPSLQPNEAQRLISAADLLASDLRLAQDCAIRDGTEYTLTLTDRGWRIEHTGTGAAPEMPKPLLGDVSVNATTYELDAELVLGTPFEVEGRLATTGTAVPSVTFTATGSTSSIEDTVFVFTRGRGIDLLSLQLTVNAATGFVTASPLAKGPPSF